MSQLYSATCMICYNEVPLVTVFKDTDTYEEVLHFVNTYVVCPRCYYPNPRLYENHVIKTFVKKMEDIPPDFVDLVPGISKWFWDLQ